MIDLGGCAVARHPFYLVVLEYRLLRTTALRLSPVTFGSAICLLRLAERELSDPDSDVIQISNDHSGNRLYLWRNYWWREVDFHLIHELLSPGHGVPPSLLEDYWGYDAATSVCRALYRDWRL